MLYFPLDKNVELQMKNNLSSNKNNDSKSKRKSMHHGIADRSNLTLIAQKRTLSQSKVLASSSGPVRSKSPKNNVYMKNSILTHNDNDIFLGNQDKVEWVYEHINYQL